MASDAKQSKVTKFRGVSNTGKDLAKFSFLNKSSTFEASFEKLCLELFQFLVFGAFFFLVGG